MLYRLAYSLYFSVRFKEGVFYEGRLLKLFNIIFRFVLHDVLLYKPYLQDKDVDSVVVSLTSFPDRIQNTHLAIKSILAQSSKPNKIILWLSRDEFTDIKMLPENLTSLFKYGLQIELVEDNLKPHKKYFYAVTKYPESKIILIDDDEFYPPHLIRNFINFSKKHPNICIANKARLISANENGFKSYKDWRKITACHPPSNRLLAIGGGGVLYPPGFLGADVFNKNKIIKYALHTDDLWLKFSNHENGKLIVNIGGCYKNKFVPILSSVNTSSLFNMNFESNNDLVLQHLNNVLDINHTDYLE